MSPRRRGSRRGGGDGWGDWGYATPRIPANGINSDNPQPGSGGQRLLDGGLKPAAVDPIAAQEFRGLGVEALEPHRLRQRLLDLEARTGIEFW